MGSASREKKIKIIIGADIVPTETNEELFNCGDSHSLIGEELISIIHDSDFFVLNLETPLIDEEHPIPKSGPCLRAATSTIKGIKNMGVDLLGLCNNHINDQDEEGIKKTIEVLKENGIDYIGAGENIKKAKQPVIREINGILVGFYACAEHEFSIAEEDKYGANPFDAFFSYSDIRELQKKVGFVVVLFHGGKEDYPYPTPELRARCRLFIENGADIVIVQHTHCVGAEEDYLGKKIVYGQGNFIFDAYVREGRDTGLLVQLNLERKAEKIVCSHSYIPIVKKANCIRAGNFDEKNKILDGFYRRSRQIEDEGFVYNQYNKLAESEKASIQMLLGGRLLKNRIFVFINKLTGGRLLDKLYPKSTCLAIYDMVSCETNLEMIKEVFKE